MSDHLILGIHITDRVKKAVEVQKLLTEYGCNIKTRLGLHEVADTYCAPHGLLLLEMFGDPALCEEFAAKVAAVEGVDIQRMVFSH
ncbi:MAG: hypothetical protein RBU21_10405 [FCB group bacterium]|jgi:hypothetical protein|nr:hypothetical protein [FCB group bacterium]